MACAHFRFYGAVNYFLPAARRNVDFTHLFDWRASIKDMVESLGVPHPEIEQLVVNGVPVSFAYLVQPDDKIEVYACTETAATSTDAPPLRPPLDGKPTFILDTHLGRLAAYLRMMGFDTLYRNDYDDEELARVAHNEGRVLLTRDIGLLKRGLVIHGYFVRDTNPRRQIVELLRRYELLPFVVPFERCMTCNGLLEIVAKDAIIDRLPAHTAQYYEVFHRCCSCDQIFWRGAHHQRMQELINEVMDIK